MSGGGLDQRTVAVALVGYVVEVPILVAAIVGILRLVGMWP